MVPRCKPRARPQIQNSAIAVPSARRRDGVNNFSQLTKALRQIRVDDSETVGSGVGIGAPIGNRVKALDKAQGDLD